MFLNLVLLQHLFYKIGSSFSFAPLEGGHNLIYTVPRQVYRSDIWFSVAKFDSSFDLLLARILERETDVINWLRPAPTEFNLTYNDGKQYEPNFVVKNR